MNCAQKLILMTLLFWLSVEVYGAGATGTYNLNWGSSDEVLEYHSCGCSDSCWVAEVLDKKTRQIKARLRCDCEKSYFSIGANKIGSKSEHIYEKSCSRFENLDLNEKPKVIRKTMESILIHSSGTPNGTP